MKLCFYSFYFFLDLINSFHLGFCTNLKMIGKKLAKRQDVSKDTERLYHGIGKITRGNFINFG
jgi:hypothetical protein